MMRVLIILLSIALFIASCKQEETQKGYSVSKDFTSVEDALQFYVIGDWGRNGQGHQRDLAVMMDSAAHVVEPEFIISTGDNIYPKGVASTSDPLWKDSFEDVYTGHLLHCPWHVVLGNHDYAGNSQAEIDYTKVSRRWNMPARYFTFVHNEDGISARFIFIDTNPFEKDYYSEEGYKHEVSKQDTVRQKVWLDSVLSLNDTKWKIVSGHHPFYTGGKRAKDFNTVRQSLEPYFTKHNVDVYLAGHEHDLQYMKSDDKPTHHFVSGTGSEVRPTGKLPQTKFAESIEGIMAFSLTANQLKVQVLTYKGDVIYTTAIDKK